MKGKMNGQAFVTMPGWFISFSGHCEKRHNTYMAWKQIYPIRLSEL